MEQAWWLGIVPALIAAVVAFIVIRAFSKSTNTGAQFLVALGIGSFFVIGFWIVAILIGFWIVKRVVLGPKKDKKFLAKLEAERAANNAARCNH